MNTHVKRLLTAAAAIATVGALQAVPIGTALAYTPTITGEAECREDGSIQVNWTYTPSTGVTTLEITSPGGMSGPVSGPFEYTEVYPAGATSATLTVAVTFDWDPPNGEPQIKSNSATIALPGDACKPPPAGEWCSPGYWRQPHHLDSWAATGISPDEKYNAYFDPDLPGDPTLLEVLQSPQRYNRGTDSFNKVGDLLSGAHPDVAFGGKRVEDSCPLN
jgi:hypothetical protein